MKDYNFLIITTSNLEFNYIQSTFKNVKSLDQRKSECVLNSRKILLLKSDPGIYSLSYFLTKELMSNKFDFVINAGICGSFRNEIPKASVVRVVSDLFADTGREDGANLFEMGLLHENDFPFKNGMIPDNPGNLKAELEGLTTAYGITVNRVTQSDANFAYLVTKYNPDIETMEGAAFFYICAREKLNYLQLRAVSNRVGSDDKAHWETEKALLALQDILKAIII